MHVWFSVCLCVCVCRSEEHTSELQSHLNLVCRLLLEKKKTVEESSRGTTHATTHMLRTVALITCTVRSTRVHSATRLQDSALYRTSYVFFFNDRAPTEIYPLPLHDAFPI